MSLRKEIAGGASQPTSAGAGPDLRQIAYASHFRAAFKIPRLGSAGIPFEDEPNLEACIASQDVNGCEIFLYDTSEKQPPAERPRLKINFMPKESGVGVLALSAVQDIPEGHLLTGNMPRIRSLLKILSSTMHVLFSDRAVGGMSHEKSSRLIRQSFIEAAQQALGDKFKPLDEELLARHSREIGLGDVKTFREFRHPAIRFIVGVGLQADTSEKIRLMGVWSQKLVEKGILPQSAAYTLR
jgi:hypothetical protein